MFFHRDVSYCGRVLGDRIEDVLLTISFCSAPLILSSDVLLVVRGGGSGPPYENNQGTAFIHRSPVTLPAVDAAILCS